MRSSSLPSASESKRKKTKNTKLGEKPSFLLFICTSVRHAKIILEKSDFALTIGSHMGFTY